MRSQRRQRRCIRGALLTRSCYDACCAASPGTKTSDRGGGDDGGAASVAVDESEAVNSPPHRGLNGKKAQDTPNNTGTPSLAGEPVKAWQARYRARNTASVLVVGFSFSFGRGAGYATDGENARYSTTTALWFHPFRRGPLRGSWVSGGAELPDGQLGLVGGTRSKGPRVNWHPLQGHVRLTPAWAGKLETSNLGYLLPLKPPSAASPTMPLPINPELLQLANSVPSAIIVIAEQ
uniref:Uncharacterized protein n=1 Tax=Panagrellus redivivus TaxID=6233 RepID=A0A7E4UVG9_PANRE